MSKKLNILVIGSGGREHALCYGIKKSPLLDELYISPGNGGSDDFGHVVDLDVKDHLQIMNFVDDNEIDFVVIGPEDPLVDGLATSLRAADILCFGPDGDAAVIEGSKGYMKDLCKEFGIPTAAYERFDNADDAKIFAAKMGAPLVVKADGLAAGKGVIIAQNMDEANSAIDEMFGGLFGDASTSIVVEEFMVGEEASFFALINGENILPLIGAQDHKAVGEGDTGLNTGGMGAYSPAPILDDAMTKRVMDEIIEPTAKAMARRGTPFCGALFAGLMITETGPKLIEYNARFGDPEIQVIVNRLQSDLLEILYKSAKNEMDELNIKWSDDAVMNVVMAANGYPEAYEKGSVIENIAEVEAMPHISVFHAGTKKSGSQILANGGRVLNIIASGKNVTEAAKRAYEAIDVLDWEDGFCRRDIGHRAIKREAE